jgi:hypothetical protein
MTNQLQGKLDAAAPHLLVRRLDIDCGKHNATGSANTRITLTRSKQCDFCGQVASGSRGRNDPYQFLFPIVELSSPRKAKLLSVETQRRSRSPT